MLDSLKWEVSLLWHLVLSLSFAQESAKAVALHAVAFNEIKAHTLVVSEIGDPKAAKAKWA